MGLVQAVGVGVRVTQGFEIRVPRERYLAAGTVGAWKNSIPSAVIADSGRYRRITVWVFSVGWRLVSQPTLGQKATWSTEEKVRLDTPCWGRTRTRS